MSTLPSAPGVYVITFLSTGEKYVGASRNMRSRFRQHQVSKLPSAWIQRVAEQRGVTTSSVRQDMIVDEWEELPPSASHDDIAQAETRWIQKVKPSLNDQSCRTGRFAQKRRPMTDAERIEMWDNTYKWLKELADFSRELSKRESAVN